VQTGHIGFGISRETGYKLWGRYKYQAFCSLSRSTRWHDSAALQLSKLERIVCMMETFQPESVVEVEAEDEHEHEHEHEHEGLTEDCSVT
jgi:transposase